MKTIKSPRKCLSLLATMLVTAVGIFGLASCERYDLDQRMPSQLGASIYDYLVENGFDTYVKLIDDTTLIDGHRSYHDVLSRTGSKTLFVADEEAVKRFYKKGIFKKADGSNVECYEDLSWSQKRMLLFGAMLDNVYQSANLSSREDEEGGDPKVGDCMRRLAQHTDIYDSVSFITPENMPDNPYWESLKATDGIRCLSDATSKPMIIFTPKFKKIHKMEDKDYNFLFHHNDGKTCRADEVNVNGVSMKEGKDNQRCMNGFVHVMEEVVYPLPNMADMLATLENTQIYKAILDRFCAPYIEFSGDNDGTAHTKSFNKTYRLVYGDKWEDVDHLYQKRYFSARSQSGDSLGYTSNKTIKDVQDIVLRYDIGWNSYFTKAGDMSSDIAIQKDMGVMLVPDDEAMINWWNGKDGSVNPLKERYGTRVGDVSTAQEAIDDMKGVPNSVIRELVNNGLLLSLVNSVPSRFDDVMNDAMDPMGIKEEDVIDVKMCCNGALYITNKPFSPTSYKSVAFPVLVNKSLEVLNWAVDKLGFKPYLNSMVSQYSFFIPEGGQEVEGVENCLVYTSPIIETAAAKYNRVYAFHFDDREKTVKARKYYADAEGNPDLSKEGEDVGDIEIQSVLNDLLNYHIVLGHVEGTVGNNYEYGTQSDYAYFKTKGGGVIRFNLNGSGDSAVRKVWGGYQLVSGREPAKVVRVYNQRDDAEGNGRSYILDKALYASPMTVAEIVTDNENYPEFETFGKLLESSTLIETGKDFGGENISIFNTYNYTVYVPGNEDLNKLIADKKIVYGEDLATLQNYYKLENMIADYKGNHGGDTLGFGEYYMNIGIKLHQLMMDTQGPAVTHEDSVYTPEMYVSDMVNELDNFIKYHIQDNSIYVTSDYYERNGGVVNYETSYLNSDEGVFCKLAIGKDAEGSIEIKDYNRQGELTGNVHKVVNTPVNGRDYYNIMCREYEYKTEGNSRIIYTSSYAVVHLIDSPFSYGEVSKFGYGKRNLYSIIK